MRKLTILIITFMGIGLFYDSLYELALFSFQNPLLSHTLLIPAVSLYIFWTNRKSIFSDMVYSPFAGAGLMIISFLVVLFQKYRLGFLSQSDTLFVLISCMIIWILGGFLMVFGRQSFKRALFPLLFLAFMIPVPSLVLDPVVGFLQSGSAFATKTILSLLNVPVHIEGMIISLPGVTVEIAEQCSGINSALALVILCTVACYMYLNSNWRRVVFVILAFPITIIKNGMRIVTLALLGSYVDISYLTDSALHRSGGKPFFLVAILMMAPIFWLLKRSERKAEVQMEGEEQQQSRVNGTLEISNNAPSA